MNHPNERNQEKSQTYTSTLINLFEQKGYECEEITEEEDTVYVMRFMLSNQEKSFEPKPKISIH